MKIEKLLKNKFLYKKNKNIFKYLYFYYYKFIHKFDVNKSYSFNGIDLLINYLFKSLNDGIYIDVGCFHPVKGNNTFKLFQKGWKGINIDIDYHSVEMFNFFRPNDFNKQIAISDKQGESDLFFYHNRSAINTLSRTVFESRETKPKEIKKIKTNTLNSVIEESPFKSKKINFVNIDVEGYEMNVLKGFDIEKYYPDVVVVGELRDMESMAAALTIAETGHLVFGTLHTNTASGTINRLVDAFPADKQDVIRINLSMSLLAVVAQQLVPNKIGERSLATEILISTPAIQSLIRENNIHQIDNYIKSGKNEGMIRMDDSLLELFKMGEINAEDTLRYSIDQKAVKTQLDSM